jgi:hypothetical protein
VAAGAELLAGAMPFRTAAGVDVLPVEAQIFTRRAVAAPSAELLDYYRLLYASYGQALGDVALYESIAFDPAGAPLVPADSIDNGFWIGLFARERDAPGPDADDPWAHLRRELGGRVLALGLVPVAPTGPRTLPPQGGNSPSATESLIRCHVAQPDDGLLRFDASGAPAPAWAPLTTRFGFDPAREAGVAEIILPPADALRLWRNLDPLEAGVGAMPPAIPDARAAARLITWIRVSSSAASLKLRWAGINCAMASQVTRIIGEALGNGDGTPGQRRQLARAPVVEGSVAITSITADGEATDWTAVDDLLAAAPEVAAPGASIPPWAAPTTSFKVDAESGVVQFGDGLAGTRPRSSDRLVAAYLASEGAQGNVAAGAIKAGPLLPGGIEATNPVPAWGGAEAETVADGERQISRLIGNRDRLVTAEDFRSIAWRTPGVAIGRIEVLPGWHPDLATAGLGFAPGVVTLLAIPASDGLHPAAPRSDAAFLDALCRWLDPRRLVTTELHLRGAQYRGLWISVGVEVAPGHGSADVLAAVRARLVAFLSPLPADGLGFAAEPMLYAEPDIARGWPLGKAVQARTLLAEVARVAGVEAVTGLQLAAANGAAVDDVAISGIELPEILGLSVTAGPPLPLAALRGEGGSDDGGNSSSGGPRLLPVPMVAESC